MFEKASNFDDIFCICQIILSNFNFFVLGIQDKDISQSYLLPNNELMINGRCLEHQIVECYDVNYNFVCLSSIFIENVSNPIEFSLDYINNPHDLIHAFSSKIYHLQTILNMLYPLHINVLLISNSVDNEILFMLKNHNFVLVTYI